MNDWNGNGKYDSADSYTDYHMANSHTSGASSDGWIFLLLWMAVMICPPLGIIIMIVVFMVK